MTAIDFRVYPVQVQELYDLAPDSGARVRDVFGFYCSPQPMSTLIAQMEAAGVDTTILTTVDCTSRYGGAVVTNDVLAKLTAMSDRLIGFASVDPASPGAADQLRRAVGELGMRGLNLDPALQGFAMSDEGTAFPVYQAAAELRIPVTLQLGLHWSPVARSIDARPIDAEPAIAAFPEVNFVLAHCGWPWVEEALMLAIKYPNVYLDTAVLYGGRPESSVRRVFADRIGLDVVEASLREKVVFASDYPRVDPKRVARAVDLLGLREITRRKVMGENAASLLGQKGIQ